VSVHRPEAVVVAASNRTRARDSSVNASRQIHAQNQPGETAEDRFFGVKDPRGIIAIKLSNSAGGIEVDHVQFGVAPPPVPALSHHGSVELAALLLLGAALAESSRRRITLRSSRS
jgi:hypothetical protein